jgi:nitrite reductase/ring-hydroxylating ferredoxin subunit
LLSDRGISMSISLPWLIGHIDAFEVNKPYRIDLNSKKYVLWKDNNSKINILPNTCPHRGGSLSDGCIQYDLSKSCIRCPFHTQLFDGQGYWHDEAGAFAAHRSHPLISPAKFKVKDGLIWLYDLCREGTSQSSPSFRSILEKGGKYICSTPLRIINSPFRKLLAIGYDFNHVAGTHNNYFGIKKANLKRIKWNLLDAESEVEIGLENKPLLEKLIKPQFFILPQKFNQRVTHFFPSLFVVEVTTRFGTSWQIFYYYPVNDKQSAVGGIIFGTYPDWLAKLMTPNAIYSTDLIIQQDMIETERQTDVNPLFKLANDEIIDRALTTYTMYCNEQLTLEDQWIRRY